MDVTYAEIIRIEDEHNELHKEIYRVMDQILAAEERVYNDNADALDPGFVDNPFSDSYHFANIGATYYNHGEVCYSVRPDWNFIELTMTLEYGDGDYASSITRKVPFEAFKFTKETEFYDMVFTQWWEKQAERQAEQAEEQQKREREQNLVEATEKKKRFDQYQQLKAEFENA